MPTLFHEIPGVWLPTIVPLVDAHIQRVALCGNPLVSGGGTFRVKTKEHKGSPDASIMLSHTRGDKHSIDPNLQVPRVVVETAHSQSTGSVMQKAWRYLYESNNAIHAVIVFVFNPKYPKKVRLQAGVWTREAIGTYADFQLDGCHSPQSDHIPRVVEQSDEGHGGELDNEEPNEGESSSQEVEAGDQGHVGHRVDAQPGTQASPQSAPDSVEARPTFLPEVVASHDFNSGPLTRATGRWFLMQTKSTAAALAIRRRSATPLTVYEENTEDGDGQEVLAEFLVLDVYDILRPCDAHPEKFISDRAIFIPLAALRKDCATQVCNSRNADEVRMERKKRENDTSSRLAEQAPVSRYLDEVQQRPKKKMRPEEKL
ncbi:hypothetical protein FRC08_013598 [Ceratobasidium sp. 394]|nr:hypothetical protein FRC08_013598 [Ceratobasidium sp. 394]